MSQYYVNTASTAGGDGTTNGTAGATRAFASLSEAEAALQAVLSEDMFIDCCGSTADSTAVTVDGWTNGSYRLTIRGNDSDSTGAHKGTSYNTGKYRVATSGGTFALRIMEASTTIFQIQVNLASAAGWGTLDDGGATISGCIVDSLILKGDSAARANGLQWNLSTNNFNKAKNLIVYDMDHAVYMRQDSAGSGNSEIINCTAVDSTTGIRGRGSNYIDTYNNLSVLNTSDWVDSSGFSSNAGYNAFKNTGTACPGSTDIDLSTYAGTDIFANYSGDDFGLLSTGSAYSSIDNDGVGPSSNSRVTAYDINNDTRSGTTTSIGADIIVTGGGNTATVAWFTA